MTAGTGHLSANKEPVGVFGHAQDRFQTRARALIYARLALMAIGLLVLSVAQLRRGLGITLPGGAYFYLGLLLLHAASYLWIGRAKAHIVIFVSLCVDLLVLLYLIIASGGIHSPLMAVQLVFTMLFTLLFPRPLAIIPPVLTLPILATVTQVLGTQRMFADLLLVLWYTALNLTVVYVVVYLEARERAAFDEVLRLQRLQRHQALVTERTRIAREIHDGVGAALSGILLQAEYLAGEVVEEGLVEEVAELREAAIEGMDELRRAVSMLHTEFELSSAIPDYSQAFAQRHRLEVDVEVSGLEPSLSPEAQLALFRILQEALSNALRHSKAKKVMVSVVFERTHVTLTVVDDGKGFDPAEQTPGHYGLRSMRERSSRVGGEVSIDSSPGEGARIEARLPTLVMSNHDSEGDKE
ncbi:MAG: sensor histidine kinase [Deltaproteobacteria bacterium]|nr:sensor histidine kinase [Deltaproteobacteria bacterium]